MGTGRSVAQDMEARAKEGKPTLTGRADREQFGETLRRLNPGVIRDLQTGGNGVDDTLAPRLEVPARLRGRTMLWKY